MRVLPSWALPHWSECVRWQGRVPHTPSPTLSPTDPVTRGLLTLCPGAYVCVHTPVDKLTERAVLHASRPAFF